MQNFMFLLEGSGETPSFGPWPTLIMLGLMLVFFYFFMIRPQKKQEKEAADMRNSLAVGDEVTTIGGIIGKVVSIKDETFVLETTKDKTKIRFLKGAVRSVDVKASDIIASMMETKEAAETPVEAPAEAPVETKESSENK